MGFNSWNTTRCGSVFDETTIRGTADTFVSAGLKDAGYTYVNIDDRWAQPARDAAGKLATSWPAAGRSSSASTAAPRSRSRSRSR
jgi:hypothetical protein